MNTFTVNELWQIFLAMCGSIVTIGGAGVVIYRLYQRAKQPDNERDKKMKEHDQKIENCTHRLDSVEGGMAVLMESVLAIMNHLIDGDHVDDLKASSANLQKYLINNKTEVLKK